MSSFFSGQIWQMINLQVLWNLYFSWTSSRTCAHARARPCLIVRLHAFIWEWSGGTGHWMEIMKALVQGSGKEDKFGSARWGKEGGSKPQAAHFYTRFRWVWPRAGEESRDSASNLSVSLRNLSGAAEHKRRRVRRCSLVSHFARKLHQSPNAALDANEVFLASCWASEDGFFSKAKQKKNYSSFVSSILVNSIFLQCGKRGNCQCSWDVSQ